MKTIKQMNNGVDHLTEKIMYYLLRLLLGVSVLLLLTYLVKVVIG